MHLGDSREVYDLILSVSMSTGDVPLYSPWSPWLGSRQGLEEENKP